MSLKKNAREFSLVFLDIVKTFFEVKRNIEYSFGSTEAF